MTGGTGRVGVRRVVAVVAGLVAVAVLSGWGSPLVAPRGDGDRAAAQAVRALVGDVPERALAAVPTEFGSDTGYRPVVEDGVVARPDGGCSSPLGSTPFGFAALCARHDLGYDLLRYAAERGDPLGGWARRAIDDQFAAGLHARCRERPELGPACAAAAGLYVAAVRLNTWRQGGGAPVAEDGGQWAAALAVGATVAVGAGGGVRATARPAGRRRPRRTVRVRPLDPAGGRSRRSRRRTVRMRPLDPAGIAVAALAAALSLTPSLLPLDPVVQGMVSGIVALHGYAAGALAGAATRWVARSRRPAARRARSGLATAALVVAGVLAAGAARLQPIGAVVSAVLATALLLGAVALARWLRRAAGSSRVRAVLAVLGLTAAGLIAPAVAPAEASGREGLRFVADDLDASEVGAVTGGLARDPVRVYVALGDAPTLPERVDLALTELERTGAFARSAILVVVPTGSGWVNPAAVRAVEHLTRGDVATVAVQYAERPSWQEYVLGTGEAERTAVALVGALRERPGRAGPRLLVYGESLGALGALPAVGAADAALLAGVPAAAWDPLPGGTVVAHPDDPVAWWSLRLLVRPPSGWAGPWLPVVTFWQVTGSLPGALSAPPGHGHRYGGELVDAWTSVGAGFALPPVRLAAVRAAVDIPECRACAADAP